VNNPLVNLLIFFGLCLGIWLITKLLAQRHFFYGKKKQVKTQTEDILKQLYHVEQSNHTATLNDLSGALEIKKTRLLPLIESITASGHIRTIDGRLQLTDSGRTYAIKIVRFHRLWEKYLAENTGHKADEWHDLAEKMEHELDSISISELESKLGNPMFDPHGDPIPSAKGEVMEVKWQPMASYPPGQAGKIVHIEDEPNAIYQQILAQRILVGSHIKVKKSTDSEIVFTSEGRDHRLSPIVAANINVTPLADEEAYEEHAIRLSSLKNGEKAKIIGISQECRGNSRRRLLDLGILPGTTVEVDLRSPLEDPIAYRIRETSIALRNSLADLILITKINSYVN